MKSFWRALFEVSLRKWKVLPGKRLASLLDWRALAPLKVEIFCSLVALGKVSMMDNLRRCSSFEAIFDFCLLCGIPEEALYHPSLSFVLCFVILLPS